jgi:hypothetical protein
MFVYLLKNKINGKEYVGKSRRSDKKQRLREHKRKTNLKRTGGPLYEEIRLFGSENFEYSILIDNIIEEKDLNKAERELIISRNSLYPNGYNLEYISEDGSRMHVDGLGFMSYSQQGIKKKKGATSSYSGVFSEAKKWRTYIAKNHRSYSRPFNTEVEAAREYDKMAIKLYGDGAPLNFEDSKNFPQEEIDLTFIKFTSNPYSSKYKGVSFNETKNRWRATVQINRKCVHVKYVKEEVEAARLSDMAVLYYGIDRGLNFPELRPEYEKIDLKSFFQKSKKSSKYKGVSFYKPYQKFTAHFIHDKIKYFCGYHLDEDSAFKAILNKKKEIGL